METKTLFISRAESPNFPLKTLKIETKQENDSQFNQLEVASWREDEKYIHFDEKFKTKFHRENSQDEFNESKPLERVVGEKENLDKKEFDPCTKYETGNSKNESDKSNDSSYSHKSLLKSEIIEQEEVHLKDEDEEDKLNRKNIDVMTITEPCAITNGINNQNATVEDQFLFYQCPDCPYRTIRETLLKSHLIKHKTENKIDWYSCPQCPYKTCQKNNLKTHSDIHNNLINVYETLRPINLKNRQINGQYSFKTSLRNHMLSHKSYSFKCTGCSYQARTKQQLTIHQVKHESTDKWPSCSVCLYKTYSKKILHDHYRRRHNANPNNYNMKIGIFKCSKCPYETESTSRATMHQLIHNQSSWLQCPDCAYRTPYKVVITQHQVRHQREKAEGWHECLKCPYKTPYERLLQCHVLSHGSAYDVKRFECSQCSFKTTYKNYLSQHELNHKQAHKVEWLYCYECSYRTNSKSQLVSHMSMHKKQT